MGKGLCRAVLPDTSVPFLLHCSRAGAWTAAWEEQAEPQGWGTASRAWLWAKGKAALALWEGLESLTAEFLQLSEKHRNLHLEPLTADDSA